MIILTPTKDEPIQMIDCGSTMYPTMGYMIYDNELSLTSKYSTLYGYALGKSKINCNSRDFHLEKGDFFSIPCYSSHSNFTTDSSLLVLERKGFLGQQVVGAVEEKGRLCYIDGCSDSTLVYPPRFGDPTLNSLHFPKNTTQTFHTHPSVRIGCVIRGKGAACERKSNETIGGEHQLKEGDFWLIEEQELHRFRTFDEELVVIAFHPDSEFGPKDHDHAMLNRTYINIGNGR